MNNFFKIVHDFVFCFWPFLQTNILDIFAYSFREMMILLMSILALLPIPDALANFQWPQTEQQFVNIFIYMGVPQCLLMYSGAFLIRFLKGLIPFIHA